MRIYAVGGGSLEETRPMDLRFVQWAGVDRPRLVYLPTASMDSEERIEAMRTHFEELGCRFEAIRLYSGESLEALERADLVYVGGGNTKAMLEIWRQTGTDVALKRLAEQGKPLGGISAGAICWFRAGNSDWPQFEGIPDVLTDRVDGMGWIDLVLCPHVRDEEFRLPEFRRMMQTEPGVGIGVDDGCAIQIEDGKYRLLHGADPSSGAYRVTATDVDRMEAHEDWRPLTEWTG